MVVAVTWMISMSSHWYRKAIDSDMSDTTSNFMNKIVNYVIIDVSGLESLQFEDVRSAYFTNLATSDLFAAEYEVMAGVNRWDRAKVFTYLIFH